MAKAAARFECQMHQYDHCYAQHILLHSEITFRILDIFTCTAWYNHLGLNSFLECIWEIECYPNSNLYCGRLLVTAVSSLSPTFDSTFSIFSLLWTCILSAIYIPLPYCFKSLLSIHPSEVYASQIFMIALSNAGEVPDDDNIQSVHLYWLQNARPRDFHSALWLVFVQVG